MTLDQFRHVLNSIPTLYSIKLVGMGEPLLNPSFFDMVRLARKRRIQVKTTTNGSLLDVARRKELLCCGLTRVDISIDGVTAATHEALRPGSCFDVIIDNVAALVRERGIARSPQIRLWGVQQEANREEMPLLKKLGRRLGVDDVGVQAGMTNFGNPEVENSLRGRACGTATLKRSTLLVPASYAAGPGAERSSRARDLSGRAVWLAIQTLSASAISSIKTSRPYGEVRDIERCEMAWPKDARRSTVLWLVVFLLPL